MAAVRVFARVACVCLAIVGGLRAQESARDLFDNTVMHEVRIEVDPADWSALKENYLEDTYYHANVVSGPFAAYDVGIRSRGRGSRTAAKPNLDINIDKYAKKQKFAGLDFVVLKANNQDPSMLHEMLAFALYRKMGIPAPREAPARLYVNGEYAGFYMLVEHEDEDFLDRNLGESSGDLFEWDPNDSYQFQDLGDDPAPYANLLDPKANEDNPDFQKFIDLVKAINYSSDPEFPTAVSRYLDLKLYLTLVATENAIAEIDGLWESVYGTNNIYLYRFTGQDQFLFMPWDKDLAFWSAPRPLPIPLNNVLGRRLWTLTAYRNFYLGQVAKAAELMGGTGGWADQEVTRLYTLIRDAANDDPNKQCIDFGAATGPHPCGAGSFEQGVRDLRSFLSSRANVIRSWLAEQRYVPASNGPALLSISSGQAAPGAIVTVRGTGFGSDTVVEGRSLARSAGRSFVAVEGVRAPLAAISDSEATVQIPWDIPMGSASIAVAASGAFTNTLNVAVTEASPAIVAVTHADGTAVDGDHPASAGETITVYCTGLGAVTVEVDDGDPSPAGLVYTEETPSVAVGGTAATVTFSGLTPGQVGLYQVNTTLPAVATSESKSLSLTIGGKTVSVPVIVQ